MILNFKFKNYRQVKSAAWRGSQGGTGIPESSEDMLGKSLNEGTVTWRDTLA
jgi:hypothetical protein